MLRLEGIADAAGERPMSEDTHQRFPNFAGKHAEAALFTPHDLLAYQRERGRLADTQIPPNVVMCYSPSLSRSIAERRDARQIPSPAAGTFHLLEETDGRVGVAGGFGIGAPAAAAVLETLTALGVERFISIGAAGTLQPHVRAGDTMLCTAAVRDEGVSHHYLEPALLAHPSETLTQRLGSTLAVADVPFVEGATWTIDAPYRETVAEARHYQAQGVVAVEMEAAALFAVASYRSVDAASAFVASDSLAGTKWTPSFGTVEVREGLQSLFAAAVDACC